MIIISTHDLLRANCVNDEHINHNYVIFVKYTRETNNKLKMKQIVSKEN